jgi:hypothetical protein
MIYVYILKKYFIFFSIPYNNLILKKLKLKTIIFFTYIVFIMGIKKIEILFKEKKKDIFNIKLSLKSIQLT